MKATESLGGGARREILSFINENFVGAIVQNGNKRSGQLDVVRSNS